MRCLLLTLFALLRVEGLPLLVLLLLLQLLQLLRLLLAEFRNRMRLQRRSGLCPIVMGCLLLQRVRAYLRQMLFLRLSVLLLPLLAFLRGIGRLAAGLHIERVLVGGRSVRGVRIRGAFGGRCAEATCCMGTAECCRACTSRSAWRMSSVLVTAAMRSTPSGPRWRWVIGLSAPY